MNWENIQRESKWTQNEQHEKVCIASIFKSNELLRTLKKMISENIPNSTNTKQFEEPDKLQIFTLSIRKEASSTHIPEKKREDMKAMLNKWPHNLQDAT